MTNKHNNWDRLVALIEWTGMSTNRFAMSIGLARAENLYHIKRGNFGISEVLAERIIARFPEIDKTWLLTGVGAMLKADKLNPVEIPYYFGEAEEILPNLGELEPLTTVRMPFHLDCDAVVRSMSRAMNEPLCVATDLYIKRVDVNKMVQGNEYLMIFDDGTVMWRRVRINKGEEAWRLVARNREEFDDVVIDYHRVVQAWRVITRMEILES